MGEPSKRYLSIIDGHLYGVAVPRDKGTGRVLLRIVHSRPRTVRMCPQVTDMTPRVAAAIGLSLLQAAADADSSTIGLMMDETLRDVRWTDTTNPSAEYSANDDDKE